MSVRSRTGVLGKGTPRVPPFTSQAVLTDAVSVPEHPGVGINDTNSNGQATLRGGSYYTVRDIRFNRIVLGLFSRTAPFTGRVAVYQHPDGVIGTAALVATATFVDSPAGVRIALVVPAAAIVRGIYWVLHGQAAGAGAYALQGYNVANLGVDNNVLAAGDHPTSFATTIASAAAAPATFDPLQGGASGVAGDGLDNVGIYRLHEA